MATMTYRDWLKAKGLGSSEVNAKKWARREGRPLPGSVTPTTSIPPNILQRYPAGPKPVADPGFLIKTRGGGKGYVRVADPNYVAPTAPAAIDPYANYPWAKSALDQIDKDQVAQQDYIANKVSPWLSQSLTNLTGVNPANPGINTTTQQQYLANVQGAVGGAMSAAQAAAPAGFTTTTPGGIGASPTSYLSGAAQVGAVGRSSSMLQGAQAQSALNTLQPNTQAQAYTYQLAATQAGLPALYAERRSAAKTKIDQYIFEFEAKQKQQDVANALASKTALASINLSLAQLGLSKEKLAYEMQKAANELAQAGQVAGPGLVYNGSGGVINDPNVADVTNAGAGSAAVGKPGTSLWFQEHGWRKVGAKEGPKTQARAEVAKDGSGKWVKNAPVLTGPENKAKNGVNPSDVVTELERMDSKAYFIESEERGTTRIIAYLKKAQPKKAADFAKWYDSVRPLIVSMKDGDSYAKWVDTYIESDGGFDANGDLRPGYMFR